VAILTLASTTYAVRPDKLEPPGLRPTEVNVFPTLDRSLLGPQLAVNPTNPDNIVLVAVADTGYTQACIAAVVPGSPCELVPRPGIPGIAALAPRGYMSPGFLVKGVFTSFDHGQTWTKVDISNLRPAGHPELYSRGEIATHRHLASPPPPSRRTP
jgi:hypothetical protein